MLRNHLLIVPIFNVHYCWIAKLISPTVYSSDSSLCMENRIIGWSWIKFFKTAWYGTEELAKACAASLLF